MGDRGFDDEIMELELDDELFSSPSPKTPPGRPATMTRANPLASLGGPLPKIWGASTLPPLGSKGRLGGGLNPLAARPVSVSTSAASSSSSPSAPTEAALAARASTGLTSPHGVSTSAPFVSGSNTGRVAFHTAEIGPTAGNALATNSILHSEVLKRLNPGLDDLEDLL